MTTQATATIEAAPGIRGLLGISAFRGIAIANTIVAGLFLGGGLVAIGLSQVYVLTAIFAFMWGMSGGIAMTLLHTLTRSTRHPS